MTGFDAADVTVTNATKGSFTAASSTVYTLAITPTASSVSASVVANKATDLAGNSNTASNSWSINYDATAPTVVITSNQDPGPTNNSAITLTFTFSESVTGFDATDVTVTNATKGSFTAASSTVYTLAITPTASAVSASVAANKAGDSAGNVNIASNSWSINYDATAPTVVITSNRDPGPTNNAAITLTFTFSEPVTGFDAADVTVTNATKGSFTAASSTVYTLAITPSPGSLSASVAANKATDMAGNGNLVSNDWLINYFSWQQEAYLKASNTEPNHTTFSGTVGQLPTCNSCMHSDFLGSSVSISGDTIVAGAYGEQSNQTTITNGGGADLNNSLFFAGAAYVFRRNGTQWVQEAYLKAPNTDFGDMFGNSASISGDTIVIGAKLEDSSQTTITNGSGASSDNASPDSGAAYVFRRANETWANEAYLKAPNAGGGDQFGQSVSISGDTIVIGANFEDSNQTTITNGSNASSNNSTSQSGAAYVFKRSGNTWYGEAYLKAPNAAADDNFGGSVSISGDTIVVGAPNEDGGQRVITNFAQGQISSVSPRSDSGAVYVYRRTDGVWAGEAYLKAPNADAGDAFGGVWGWQNVSISGDTILVGAPGEDSTSDIIINGSGASSHNYIYSNGYGAAYVFKRNGNLWSSEAYLKPPISGDWLWPDSLSISGDRIVCGATRDWNQQNVITNGEQQSYVNNGSFNAGSAFVFRRSGNLWANEAYLKSSNSFEQSLSDFGSSVAISGDVIAVGAMREQSNQNVITNGQESSPNRSSQGAGAVYVFRRVGAPSDLKITAVTPNLQVEAGQNIIIFGQGFVRGATVTVGGQACLSTTVQGSNEIICKLPANPSDTHQVQVTNPNSSASNTNMTVTYKYW